jgi:hypothetical protein
MGKWLDMFDNNSPPYETAEDVVRAIYAGTFRSNCHIPVKPGPFVSVLGTSIWVCHDGAKAMAKQRAGELAFTVAEFMAMIDAARRGADKLKPIIEAKKAFGGTIMQGGFNDGKTKPGAYSKA